MGINVVNTGAGLHTEGASRVVALWGGIKSPPSGGPQHESYTLGLASDAAVVTDFKAACKDAHTGGETAFVAALPSAAASWLAGLPSDVRSGIVADAAAWHVAGYGF